MGKLIIIMRMLGLEMRAMMNIKITWGGRTSDVRYTGGAIDAPSDLEWSEIETTGPVSKRGVVF